MSFLDIKRKARADLHHEMGVPSKHISAASGRVSDCRVRVHTKINLTGDIDYQGFAELSDGAVVVMCTIREARALGFAVGDKIVYDSKEYVLNTRLDDDGIYIEKWQATHLQQRVNHDYD